MASCGALRARQGYWQGVEWDSREPSEANRACRRVEPSRKEAYHLERGEKTPHQDCTSPRSQSPGSCEQGKDRLWLGARGR
jgi:hypothetical protein